MLIVKETASYYLLIEKAIAPPTAQGHLDQGCSLFKLYTSPITNASKQNITYTTTNEKHINPPKKS